MSAIINAVKAIAEGVTTAIEFLGTIIADTAYIVSLCAEFVVQIPEYLSFMPPAVLALIVSMFVVVVIYKVLGRE